MAQLPCIGLYKPSINLPFGDCAMYFDHGVNGFTITPFWGAMTHPTHNDRLAGDSSSSFSFLYPKGSKFTFGAATIFVQHAGYDSSGWDKMSDTVDGRNPAPPGM